MKKPLKTLLPLLTAVGLAGCAVYPAPGYDYYGTTPPYGVVQPYAAGPPVYLHGSVVYQYDSYNAPRVYPRSYYRAHPGFIPQPPPRPHGHVPHTQPRDSDRDRDGDGVPNRADRRPDDPRRR